MRTTGLTSNTVEETNVYESVLRIPAGLLAQALAEERPTKGSTQAALGRLLANGLAVKRRSENLCEIEIGNGTHSSVMVRWIWETDRSRLECCRVVYRQPYSGVRYPVVPKKYEVKRIPGATREALRTGLAKAADRPKWGNSGMLEHDLPTQLKLTQQTTALRKQIEKWLRKTKEEPSKERDRIAAEGIEELGRLMLDQQATMRVELIREHAGEAAGLGQIDIDVTTGRRVERAEIVENRLQTVRQGAKSRIRWMSQKTRTAERGTVELDNAGLTTTAAGDAVSAADDPPPPWSQILGKVARHWCWKSFQHNNERQRADASRTTWLVWPEPETTGP